MTSKEADTPTGKRIIEKILAMCHDGMLELHEVEDLHVFLGREGTDIAAAHYLRAITRDAVADGRIDDVEAYRLKQAFLRVVPKEVRSVVATHLESIELPGFDDDDTSAPWKGHPATARQIAYVVDLGGTPTPGMTKGDASELIDRLLERRPVSPRQVMLLRFFDRMDLATSTKNEVSEWVDAHYELDPRHEAAWARFKRETNHDPACQDPTVVPIGAYRRYMRVTRTQHWSESRLSKKSQGCLPGLAMLIVGVCAACWLLY